MDWKTHPLLRLFVGLCCALFSASALCGAELQPKNGLQFYLPPDETAELGFLLPAPAGGAVEFVVRDRALAEVTRGRAQVAGRDATVTLKLPQGFYEIEFPATQQSFGLLALPVFTKDRDPFFGMDAALTWLTDDSIRRERVAIMKRLGIASARERLLWGELNPAPGQWAWPARDGRMREAYAREGMPVLECFHDTPAYLRAKNSSSRYPDDLLVAYREWRHFLSDTKEARFGLEIWNEPDIGFGGNLPADQYMSVLKAVVAAGRSAGFTPPLVGGAFTSGATRGFLKASFDSGLAEIVDGVSFHFYGEPAQLVQFSKLYRDLFAEAGHGGMPLWLTETGRPWPVDTPPRPLPANAHEGAFTLALNAIEAKATGIAHYYPFVFSNRVEGTRRYGVIDRAHSPLSSLAAYSQAIRVLSGKGYVGDLKNPPAHVARARVFSGGGETVLVLAADYRETGLRFVPGAAVIRAEAIDGRVLARNADGGLPLDGGLVYLWIDPGAWGANIDRDTEAARLLARSREPLPPRRVPSLAMKVRIEQGAIDQHSNLAYFVSQSAAAAFPLTVEVNNFRDVAQTVAVELVLPEGARLVSGAARRTVTLPANGKIDEKFMVDGSAVLGRGQLTPFTLRAHDTGGPVAERLVFSLGLVPEKPKINLSRAIGRVTKESTIDHARWRQLDAFTPSRHVRLGVDQSVPNFAREDLHITGRFAWSDGGFVFFYEVTDDQHHTVGSWEGWTGDSVQMAFTSLRSQASYREPADFEVLVAQQPGGAGEVFLRARGKAVKTGLSDATFVTVERDEKEKKTYYHGQIGWKDLSTLTIAPYERFAFSFLVNDNDGAGRKGWIEMTSGIGGHKGTYGFAEMTLLEQ